MTEAIHLAAKQLGDAIITWTGTWFSVESPSRPGLRFNWQQGHTPAWEACRTGTSGWGATPREALAKLSSGMRETATTLLNAADQADNVLKTLDNWPNET
jgi:hypothetical protein